MTQEEPEEIHKMTTLQSAMERLLVPPSAEGAASSRAHDLFAPPDVRGPLGRLDWALLRWTYVDRLRDGQILQQLIALFSLWWTEVTVRRRRYRALMRVRDALSEGDDLRELLTAELLTDQELVYLLDPLSDEDVTIFTHHLFLNQPPLRGGDMLNLRPLAVEQHYAQARDAVWNRARDYGLVPDSDIDAQGRVMDPESQANAQDDADTWLREIFEDLVAPIVVPTTSGYATSPATIGRVAAGFASFGDCKEVLDDDHAIDALRRLWQQSPPDATMLVNVVRYHLDTYQLVLEKAGVSIETTLASREPGDTTLPEPDSTGPSTFKSARRHAQPMLPKPLVSRYNPTSAGRK